MSVTIVIPTPLRQFAGGKSEVEVEATTAGEALEKLTSEYADLRKHLYNDQNNLRNFVNVYVGDEDIRHLDGAETAVKDGETIMIVPSIAGGNVAAEARAEKELPALTSDEYARYSRHLILPEVGLEGQRKLKAARVLMIGTGGLGSPLGLYLAAGGVGTIGLVDFDVVDESNLQRQIIHGTKDIGRPKIKSAEDRLKDINPNTNIETYETRLTSENAIELFKEYDVVVDGTDNFQTRYLVNDACVLTGKPNVYGSIFRFEGQASVFWAEKGACYRCLYPEPPPPGLVPSCAEGGVLGVLPGIVGTIQANEVIKVILGAEGILLNRLLLFDAWNMKFRELKLKKNPDCPLCGTNPTIKELIDYEEFCGLNFTEPETQVFEEITAKELSELIKTNSEVQVIDVREPHEYEIAQIPGTKLIPLAQVVNRVKEIDTSRAAIIHCKGGTRSAKAIDALKNAGYSGRLVNLKGGITAWSDEVDSSVQKY
ncbi:MAG: molybdopterin and thiamine biosynthesis family dinucleotide-utilizing protein [Acidobacteria bacterium]|jgi:molybdopterin/thiamine biosynthesis adenylyltransferase/rhodanese-related sulfurtransferase/molybdopterin converting factor small subunit|nr:molybdopterin and thiamine biosynthesis family dinucleotide-utilizing protein [Acidobacteriota bacterium]